MNPFDPSTWDRLPAAPHPDVDGEKELAMLKSLAIQIKQAMRAATVKLDAIEPGYSLLQLSCCGKPEWAEVHVVRKGSRGDLQYGVFYTGSQRRQGTEMYCVSPEDAVATLSRWCGEEEGPPSFLD